MTIRQLRYLWYADLYRYGGRAGILPTLAGLVVNPGFRFTFWMRLTTYLNAARPRALWFPLRATCWLVSRRQVYALGISISARTRIGPGLHIGHFGGIVVSDEATIGANCNLSHGVTIGRTRRGARAGSPTIGDNVYIGPGAKIIGEVTIGHNVAVGANCVVTHDVPDNAVVVGVPGRVISFGGAQGYVNRTDYASCEEFRAAGAAARSC